MQKMWNHQSHTQLLKLTWMTFHQLQVLIPKCLIHVQQRWIPFHVIFDLNKIVITTRFDRGSHIVFFCLGLKEFWKNALLNFRCIFGLQPSVRISIIIWINSSTKHKSLYMFPKCLIRNFSCEICVSYLINLTNQSSTRHWCFFSAYPYIHIGNMLLIDDMPYKNMFNGLYNAIFLKSFHGLCGED